MVAGLGSTVLGILTKMAQLIARPRPTSRGYTIFTKRLMSAVKYIISTAGTQKPAYRIVWTL